MDQPQADVLYTVENGVGMIKLNRPDKMNALIPGVGEGLHKSLAAATGDDEVRVIVITGSGRAFCAGADVAALATHAGEPVQPRPAMPPRTHLALLIQQCPKPVIASVNGVAVGFGLDLALACDIRIASDQARFSEAYIRRGMHPAGGGAFFLPRLVGIDRALLLSWTGDMIDAKEAERIGLVTMVVAHDELDNSTRDLAEKLAKGPALAIQNAKRAVYEGLGLDLKTSLDKTMAARQSLLSTADHKEGTTSFVEKRAPQFKGK